MGELRRVVSEAGFEDVRTYLQSGNLILRGPLPADELAVRLEGLIEDRFGFEVPVLVRTGQELLEVVKRDPFREVVDEPRRYQVTFLERELDPDRVRQLESLLVGPERLAVDGREVYTWHPEGIARSDLAAKLAAKSLGVKGTARNWRTVMSLLSVTDEA
jgi:uncharacterized protein (DUF1697 family)